MRGTELAMCGVVPRRYTAKRCSSGQGDATGEVGFTRLRAKLYDQHRRRRREIVWVQHLQQVLREAGKLRIDLQLDARSEKAGSFE
ncbi:hypothetical protein SDC9_161011 [bioreactor metagenome]|uniref:Uncharacterized protein n=1 Tax=bioreactor metagenome TaxID=1076179 RepID=A0A645FH80_9ZZZZ